MTAKEFKKVITESPSSIFYKEDILALIKDLEGLESDDGRINISKGMADEMLGVMERVFQSYPFGEYAELDDDNYVVDIYNNRELEVSYEGSIELDGLDADLASTIMEDFYDGLIKVV